MKTDIVVVGSMFMDLVAYADRLPNPGETIGGSDFKTGYGGKGGNQCVAAQRLGSKTAFVGKVGEDAYGHQYCNNLKSEGVNVDGIKFEKEVPSGIASIMVGSDNGQNFIITVAGANQLVTANYVHQAESMISNSKTLICQMEIPVEATKAALTLAKKHKVLSIFNVAPANFNLPNEMYELADILCLNETEAEMVCGLQGIQNREQAELAIEELKGHCNCKSVIVTLGPEGALLWDHKENSYHFVAAPIISAVVDTTGAGDCFVGTLAHCLASGDDIRTALKKAVFNASESVTKKGTQSSFPYSIVSNNS